MLDENWHLIFFSEHPPNGNPAYTNVRGREFNEVSEVFSTVYVSLKQIPEQGYSTCFKMWIEQCDLCILSERKNLEK